MIETRSLDKQIASLSDWIIKAGKALVPFYNATAGYFWRDTYGIRENDQKIHPTSTSRSFFALYEFLRFLYEEDIVDEKLRGTTIDVLKNVVEKYVNRLPEDKDAIMKSPDNGINMFTNSHFLVAISILENFQRITNVKMNMQRVKDAAREIAEKTAKDLEDWGGGKISPKDETHQFITLHAVRGLDAFSTIGVCLTENLVQKLSARIEEDTLRLNAYYFAGLVSKFDPTELAFDIALLNRFPTPDAPQITRRSIKCIEEMQMKGGSWPTSRYISYEGRGLLHVASYEVALTLAQLFIKMIYNKDIQSCELLLSPLDKAFELVKSNYVVTEGVSGWANDHTRRKGLLESWATAIVLLFLIYYRDALMQLRQYAILERYNVSYPDTPQTETAWPDLIPAFRKKDWIDMAELDFVSDWTDNNALTESIRKKLVEPISEDLAHRPSKKSRTPDSVSSVIIHGPPATRKTSLVKAIARTLRWPLLTLTSTNFLVKGGLESVESSKAEIFDDLLRLRRVVVLFDEFEDFVRTRKVDQVTESRTEGAFITSGMLVPLQELREKSWVIFFLATNLELEKLDEAVTRLGRFDVEQRIDYPTLNAQMQYVQKKMMNRGEAIKIIREVLSEYERGRIVGKSQRVTFSYLDELTEKVSAIGDVDLTKERVFELLKNKVLHEGPRSLVE